MYKLSVHLLRLRDLTQHITNAASVEKYKPKEQDSFIFNHKAYTLSGNRKAEEGDLLLIHNPMPDSLDTYSLNEIDVVETVDKQGVVTSNSHGIKHNEYLLMVPGRTPNSHPIDYQNTGDTEPENLHDNPTNDIKQMNSNQLPSVGDIYKKIGNNEELEAMVVAIKGETVYLGSGLSVSQEELLDPDKWEYLYHLLDK